MSQCDLALHAERPDRAYAPGERILGRVSVTAREDVQVKGLELKGWPSWQRDFPIGVWP